MNTKINLTYKGVPYVLEDSGSVTLQLVFQGGYDWWFSERKVITVTGSSSNGSGDDPVEETTKLVIFEGDDPANTTYLFNLQSIVHP